MARTRNQASRRTELVAAASRAVLERGVAGVRLRDIAEEAGLSKGSVLYYYADVEELLTEAFSRGTVQYCVLREQRVTSAGGASDQLRACIASGVPRSGASASTSQLLYELMPVVIRNPRGARLYADLFDRQARLYQDVLDRGASTGDLRLAGPSRLLADTFVALEDGLGILVLTGARAAEQVEQTLLEHAHLVAGL